jgi:SnoaL-like domain
MDHRDIVEIQQLMAAYGHAVDAPDQSLLPLIFTEDAQFDGRPCGDKLYVGLKAISDWFARGKPPHPPAHHMTNVWVREEAGKVKVSGKFIVVDERDGQVCMGDYDDTVVRSDAGWRIKHRICTYRFPKPDAAIEKRRVHSDSGPK